MSGQPSREPRFDPYGRSQSSGRTERAPQQQQPQYSQPAQPQYETYADPQEPEGQWDDDYGYEDDYEYEEYQPEREPVSSQRQPTRRQPQQSTRRYAQAEPEYDEDLYDDPYVMDDEEAPRRPRRQSPRSGGGGRGGRERAPRRSASFTLPPMIAEAPLAKDRLALGMLGAAVAGVLIMLIVVTTRRDGLDALIFTHVNANGEPENLQTAEAIWNLPLIAGMVTLISGILGWFLARWDKFLPRFLLGGSIGVQFVVWIAVIAYLF